MTVINKAIELAICKAEKVIDRLLKENKQLHIDLEIERKIVNHQTEEIERLKDKTNQHRQVAMTEQGNAEVMKKRMNRQAAVVEAAENLIGLSGKSTLFRWQDHEQRWRALGKALARLDGEE